MNLLKLFLPSYFLVIFLFAGSSCNASPRSSENNVNTSANKIINHSAWDRLLSKYVGDKGLVNYKGLLSNKKELENYIAYLAKINPKEYSKKEQLAYWVNAYNALTVDVILRNY